MVISLFSVMRLFFYYFLVLCALGIADMWISLKRIEVYSNMNIHIHIFPNLHLYLYFAHACCVHVRVCMHCVLCVGACLCSYVCV